MTETRLKELQTEIARLEKIDNAITEQVAAELDNGDELGSAMAWTQEDDCQRPNEDCKHESLMDCDCDTDDGGMPFEAAHTNHDTIGSFDENGDAMEFINSGGDPLELNQSNESLIARHNTKLSSEFVSAWTQEDCNEFIEVGCSLQQDMEWANESENIQ